MKRLLFAAVFLYGCSQQPAVHTTTYRYTSTSCEPTASYAAKLRAAIKSRDEWKRYAESLEHLTGTKR